ncbi:CDP-alcohol phosphatidyltransferase family protein [Parapedobacter sp. ISTM3]|uniref:CDP-alcohol phosphatidyltransferase family protein n=1 Tax=Parapedobacter sp. ISTM3 TaxID=2800130 RepID=UPI001F22BCB2|nr:CDP-alcohol phosphatidyltransferase family protein [Parapedobacter sp. ISTM3]
MQNAYHIVNGITYYRLVAAPVLLLFILTGQQDVFKWLLALSFFTDAIDGYLARRYKVVSVMGAKLDSIADDLTVLMAIVGLLVWHWPFIVQEYAWVLLLLLLFLVQLSLAFIKYGRATSFHTYLAKVAAVFQGIFLVLAFFQPSPSQGLFYVAVAVTALDIIEETIMVLLLPTWQADVKGLHEAWKRRRE